MYAPKGAVFSSPFCRKLKYLNQLGGFRKGPRPKEMTARFDALVTLATNKARTTTAVFALLLVMAAAPPRMVTGATGVASAQLPDVAGGPAAPPGKPSWPSGMPVFDPGLGPSAEPKEAAPRIAEGTRTAGPDETITASGWRLSSYSGADEGRETRFLFYGRTAERYGAWAEGLIQSIGRDKVMVTLPPSLPSNSAYLVWPGDTRR